MTKEEAVSRVASLEAVLSGLLIAVRPIATIAFNIGQEHPEFVENIHPRIRTLDAWRDRAHRTLEDKP